MSFVNESNKPTFGGHEKFVFRYGWLKKGVDAAAKDPTVFSDDTALVDLGVGKNMVRSIRHWCLAAGLFEESHAKGLGRPLQLTGFAERLVANEGWDPYLEDIGTLWLLHWQFVSNLTRTLIWHLTFCTYYEVEFTKTQLETFIRKQLGHRGISTTSDTVSRELDVCLHTYVATKRKAKTEGISEEALDCPLVELDLIRVASEDNVYRFNIGPKITLPVEILGYALFTYLPRIIGNRRTVAVDECIYKDGSPGQVFKLDENSIIEYLEALEEMTQGRLRLQETAGLRQLYLDYDTEDWFGTSAMNLLSRHYARSAN